MKLDRLLLAITFLTAFSLLSQAQSKKEIETTLLMCTASKDSIQKEYVKVTMQYDSLKNVVTAYDSMYFALKTKVVLKDFKPTDMSAIIDSIRAGGKSSQLGSLVTINDSLTILRLDNKRLNEIIKIMNAAESERSVVIYDLRQLKQLLDENIITQLEFNEKKAKLMNKL